MYKENINRSDKVSESAVVIDNYTTRMPIETRENDLEAMWQRSLTVEEFRNRCVTRLKRFYELDS